MKNLFPVIFLAASIATLTSPAPTQAQDQGMALPRLTHVGAIPPQWENETEDLLSQKVREKLNVAFPKAVRDAKRFRVLNDQVVADMWSTPQGRQELVKSYELNAFVSLSAKRLADGIRLTSRLLSPELDNYLVETETMSRNEVARLNDQGLRDHLEGLIFRLFNRLPVDVIVTSVQGRFISISGGAEQNVKTGDALQFFRTSITSQHPANGSWLSFENKFLGDAKIIEVNRYSSVAKLVSLSYDNAIKVGDGAKIPAIQSRSAFARFAKEDTDKPSTGDSAIIVPPLYPSHERKDQSLLDEVSQYRDEAAKDDATAKSPVALAAKPAPSEKPETPQAANTETPKPAGKEVAAPQESPGEEGKADDTPRSADGKWRAPSGTGQPPGIFQPFANMAEVVEMNGGARFWSASGAGSAASRLPFWIINNLGISGEKTAFSPETKVGFAGDLGFGPTGKGSFVSLAGEGRVVYEQPVRDFLEHVQFFRMGLKMKYTNVNVSGESYGGMANIRIGLLGGLRGIYPMGGPDAIDWKLDASFYPQVFGTMKAAQKTRDITNFSGFNLTGTGYLVGQRRGLEWGGMLSYSADNYKLSTRSVSTTDLYLGVTGRVRF